MRLRKFISEQEAIAAELAQLRYEVGITRELLTRIVEKQQTITFDSSGPMPGGQLKWESVEAGSGSRETTIWFIPEDESAKNGGGNGEAV